MITVSEEECIDTFLYDVLQAENHFFDSANCEYNASTQAITCGVPVTIKTNNTALTYIIRLAQEADVQTPITRSFTVVVDNTTPLIDYMETGYCTLGECFTGNGNTLVRAYFNDTITSFDRRYIFFELPVIF